MFSAALTLLAASTHAFAPQTTTTSPSNTALASSLFSSSPYAQGTSVNPRVDGYRAGPLTRGGSGGGYSTLAQRDYLRGTSIDGDVQDLPPVMVQGGSLRTWSSANPYIERVQVVLQTEGRPLNADVDLWQGPDNTPQKMRVYLEDGRERPFAAVIETPRAQNAVSIRNTGQLEFPLTAFVQPDQGQGLSMGIMALSEDGMSETIQGGALKTYSFAPNVGSVQLLLQTDGRPLNARIELLQGPNNNKQVVELYTEDGMERPFYSVIETPGVGNVVRVLNTAPMEFPLQARVEPYMVGGGQDDQYENSPVVVSEVGGGPMF